MASFVLPDGLELDLSGSGLSITFDGDVDLAQTLGKKLDSVDATGDLTLRLPSTTGALKSGGTLTITGNVDATTVHGHHVVIEGSDIKAKAISASGSITIGGAKLAVDVIIAPEITIEGGAKGRVTVIQSNNERGPTKIKGGFSLSEYEELFGDGEAFLADRGLQMLEGGVAVPAGESAPAPTPLSTEDAPTPDDEEEDVEDPLSLSIDDLELVDEEMEDLLHPKLVDALGRIQACYDDDIPPAVNELETLVQARDYNALRGSITEVWNGLLGFHQQRGIRPHHQVTHAFNVIHGLVQEA